MPEMVDRDQEHLHLLKIYYCLSRTSRPSSTSFSKFAARSVSGRRVLSASRVGWVHRLSQMTFGGGPSIVANLKKSASAVSTRIRWPSRNPKPLRQDFGSTRHPLHESSREKSPRALLRAVTKDFHR